MTPDALVGYFDRWRTELESPNASSHYARLVASHRIGVLAKVYSRLKTLQPEAWPRWAESYRLAVPSRSGDLNQSAREFPAYLRAQASTLDIALAWIELAEYEWAELETYLDPADERSVARGLNPTCRLLHFTHDIPRWVQAIDAAEPPAPPHPTPRPTAVFFARDLQAERVTVTELRPEFAECLEQIESSGLWAPDGPRSRTLGPTWERLAPALAFLRQQRVLL